MGVVVVCHHIILLAGFGWVEGSQHGVVEEKAASLGVEYLGHPVTADGVSEKWRINRNAI